MIGRVVSVKAIKTVTVLVGSRKTHPLYKKSYVWTKKYLVDDPIGVSLGDVVELIKVRPISKMKHWQITKVIGKDFVAVETEELKQEAEEAISEVLPEEKEEKPKEEQSELVESEAKIASTKKPIKKSSKKEAKDLPKQSSSINKKGGKTK